MFEDTMVIGSAQIKYTLYTEEECIDAGARAVKEGDKFKCMCGNYALNLKSYKCENGEYKEIEK